MGVYSTSVGGGSAALGCEWWGGLTIPTKLIQSHLLASLRRFFVLQPEVKMLVFLLLYTQAHRPNDQRFRPLNLFLSLLSSSCVLFLSSAMLVPPLASVQAVLHPSAGLLGCTTLLPSWAAWLHGIRHHTFQAQDIQSRCSVRLARSRAS